MIQIPLRGSDYVALIDDEDGHLADLGWFATRNGDGLVYAQRKVKRPDGSLANEYLHRAVMRAAPGQRIDHQSRNGLDCRRRNLRAASSQQNQCNQKLRKDNTSGFKGVWWSRRRGAWIAEVCVGGRKRWSGQFRNPEAAARAYDAAARRLHGTFATLNFPEPGELSAARDLPEAEDDRAA
jgi:hypothetical protein